MTLCPRGRPQIAVGFMYCNVVRWRRSCTAALFPIFNSTMLTMCNNAVQQQWPVHPVPATVFSVPGHAVRNSERFLDCRRPISEPGEPFFPLFRALTLAGAPPQFFDLAAAFVGRYVFARLREKRTANKTFVRRRFIQSKERLLSTIVWNLIP